MEVYARALLRYTSCNYKSKKGRSLHDRNTIDTGNSRAFKWDLDKAMHITSESITDWSGTRLGETIGEFLNLWGQRGMARGATVVILSDGWDRGK